MAADTLALITLQHSLLLDHGIDIVGRSILINGEINEGTVEKVYKGLTLLNLNNPEKEPITVIINSAGGSVYDAYSIVGMIQNSKCKVNAEIYGACMSSAVTIFAACDERKASKYSYFMIHQVSAELGTLSKSGIQDISKHFDKEEQLYCEFLESRSNKNKNFWKKLLSTKSDIYVGAEELFKTGLVTKVI